MSGHQSGKLTFFYLTFCPDNLIYGWSIIWQFWLAKCQTALQYDVKSSHWPRWKKFVLTLPTLLNTWFNIAVKKNIYSTNNYVFTAKLQSKLSAGNLSINCIPGVITHRAPLIVVADLHTALGAGATLQPDVTLNATCRSGHFDSMSYAKN